MYHVRRSGAETGFQRVVNRRKLPHGVHPGIRVTGQQREREYSFWIGISGSLLGSCFLVFSVLLPQNPGVVRLLDFSILGIMCPAHGSDDIHLQGKDMEEPDIIFYDEKPSPGSERIITCLAVYACAVCSSRYGLFRMVLKALGTYLDCAGQSGTQDGRLLPSGCR